MCHSPEGSLVPSALYIAATESQYESTEERYQALASSMAAGTEDWVATFPDPKGFFMSTALPPDLKIKNKKKTTYF